jgi:hypothetical protein
MGSMGITRCTRPVPESFNVVIDGAAWLNKEKYADYKCRRWNGLVFSFNMCSLVLNAVLVSSTQYRVILHFSHSETHLIKVVNTPSRWHIRVYFLLELEKRVPAAAGAVG